MTRSHNLIRLGWSLLGLCLFGSEFEAVRSYSQSTASLPPIQITTASQILGEGFNIQFNATANPVGVLQFQWFHQGIPIPGATNRNLALTNLTLKNSGSYSLAGYYEAGVSTSKVVELKVVPRVQFQRLTTIPLYFPTWVRAIDGLAYIADGSLEIYDVSNPTNVVWLGRYGTPVQSAADYQKRNLSFAFFIEGKTAYLESHSRQVAGDSKLRIVDVSLPANPVLKGEAPLFNSGTDVVVRKGMAFVATTAGLEIINVLDPVNPTKVSRYQSSSAYTVDLAEDVAFLACLSDGIHVLDIADPNQPRLITKLKEMNNGVDTVKVVGNRLYASYVVSAVYDIIDARHPVLLGKQAKYNSQYPLEGSHGMMAKGNFMLNGWDGLTVLDFSNPSQAATVGFYSLGPIYQGGTVECVDVASNLVYVAYGKGVDILEWSAATQAPVVLTSPRPALAVEKSPAKLTVHACGGEELSYQWFRDGLALTGQTNSSLRFASVQSQDAGEYSVEIANRAGKLLTETAALRLTDPPPLNLSMKVLPGQTPQLKVRLPDGLQTRLEVTTNFFDWSVIWSGQASTALLELQDNMGTLAPQRFYRLHYGIE